MLRTPNHNPLALVPGHKFARSVCKSIPLSLSLFPILFSLLRDQLMKPTREPFPAMPTTYSVGSQTFQRPMYFQNERWARLFIETLYHYRQTGIFKLHAFVVMPEHFHILLTPSTTLERTVQYLKGGFSRKARLKFHWKFPIWQNSFTDHRIRDAVDCDNHIQYIYLNPIRRKLCGVASEYPYSSAHSGFELDEPPQRLKPEWGASSCGTALHPECCAPSESEQPNTKQTGVQSSAVRVGKSQTNSLCDTRFDTLETVKIIPAKASAIPFILSVQRACPAASQWKPTDYTAAIAQPDRLVLIAEKDSKILGFAVVYTGIPEWELENVAVAPDSRRSGIGRALMAALINLARKAGATEIRQEIRISNTAAQKLGLSVGFIQEGRRPDYYRDRVEDALLFKHLLGRQ